DDVPTAVDDEATQGDEDSDVVYNVMSNGDGTSDTEGADGATLTGATVNTGAGSVSFLSNGQVTYNPVDGETGTVIIDYTITDGDNDTADATLTINLGEDSKPTVSVTDGTVDEAALSDGSNSGSTAETDTGTFTIGTGDDSLQTLTVGGVDVTAGGVVNGEYGDLTVTNTGGVYTWSYTLSDNTTDHTTQGTSTDGIKDDFSVVVTDSDDSVSSADTLTVTVQDDVPTAVDDEATQGDEDSDVVYNVMSNGDGTSDTEGADGATLTGATVNTGAGSVSFLSNGQVTYNPVDGETGTVIIDYTITDGDNDTADATLTINLGEDSKPTVSVSNAAVDETNGKTSIDGTLDVDFGNDLAGATVELSATGATWDGTDTLNADDGSWKIVNNANGTYTFTQLLIMTHSGAEDAEIVLNIGVTATDSDNSVDNASSFTVTVYDDGPVVTDKDGVINLSAGDSLEVLAYDLGEDALGGVVFSLDSSSVPLTSGDQAILTESIDTGNGLESFVGYIDLDTDGIYDVGEEVFTITPTNSNADGTYEITLSADNVLDLPTSKVELSFTGISAGGPTESVDVGSDLTISIVDAGTTVNTSNGFIGINNNVMNDNGGGETILYTFNNGLLINDLQLDIKDVGGSGDTLTWTVYNSVDNTTESGPLTINGNGLSDPISPTIDFDSVELFVTSGDFKIGGITYTDLGDPQDVMMQFGYDATDADGDVVSGSIDVTVSASTGTNITGSDLLTHSDANIDVS
ncbi:MAG: cadherin-like domain-containing protein, partial [Cycloclasticus sp.]